MDYNFQKNPIHRDIKIDPTDIELKGTIILKNKKKVRFLDEDEILKERVMKLEKEVAILKKDSHPAVEFICCKCGCEIKRKQ